MNNLITVKNVRAYLDENGTVQINLEDAARGLGFTRDKNGTEYIIWDRVLGYLAEFGFHTCVERPEFIPENIFYRLAMKAKNETAETFQAMVADEILPSIRKTGGFRAPTTMTQAQLIAGIAQIQVEQEQKLIELEGRLDGVKNTFANREEESWREWACRSVDKIVDRSGFLDHQSAWREAYGMLESRARCVLDIRKQNIRRRLAETGVSKTKLNSIGKIDAIEQDARLKEIFTAILKEMLIRYVA